MSFSGVTVMNSAILNIRLKGIAKAIRQDNVEKAKRMINDTLRVFRTAKKNTIEHSFGDVVITTFYKVLVYLHTERPVTAMRDIQYIRTINSLPAELF